MILLRQIQAVVFKDLLTELRDRQTLLSMSLVAFLVLITFSFSFETRILGASSMAPGLLWVAFLFSALLGMNRAFAAEQENHTLEGLLLCPVSAWGIFLGKLLSTFAMTALMEVFTLSAFTLLYNVNIWSDLKSLAAILFLGTLGLAAIGTLFSALCAAGRARILVFSVLFFPVSAPVLLASVKATGLVLEGRTAGAVWPWLKILAGFDLVFLLVTYLTVGFIMEE